METISKEDFISIMDDLQKSNDYQIGLNNFFRNNDVDGYIYQPDCSCSVLKLLHMIFGKRDAEEWINTFCFNFDFGKKYKGGLKDKSGATIRFSTSEDLYNILTGCKDEGVQSASVNLD